MGGYFPCQKKNDNDVGWSTFEFKTFFLFLFLLFLAVLGFKCRASHLSYTQPFFAFVIFQVSSHVFA
jgi:hypothetical protein